MKIMNNLMFTTLFLLTISAWLPPTLFAQQLWTRTYGGYHMDGGRSVIQTSEHDYLVTGHTYSFGSGWSDYWLVKVDSQGDTLWTRTYGGPEPEFAKVVMETSDSGYLISGHKNIGGSADFWLVKTNVQGDTLWTHAYGGPGIDNMAHVIQAIDEGYLIAGTTYSFGAGWSDFWVIKIDLQGEILWTRTYGTLGYEGVESIIPTDDEGYLIAGSTDAYAQQSDIYLVKIDLLGDTLWTNTYGGSGLQNAFSVTQAIDEGYIIAGYTNFTGGNLSDFLLIKINPQGDTLWTNTYGGPNNEKAHSVISTFDQGYLLVGGTAELLMVKTDLFGNTNDLTSVQPEPTSPPIEMLSVFPNPMNNQCRYVFNISEPVLLQIDIYDITGAQVWSATPNIYEPGNYSHNWSLVNKRAEGVPSGIYLLRLQSSLGSISRKLTIMK